VEANAGAVLPPGGCYSREMNSTGLQPFRGWRGSDNPGERSRAPCDEIGWVGDGWLVIGAWQPSARFCKSMTMRKWCLS